MVIAHRTHYTYADYVRIERDANLKHEYLNGQIFAMAGGSREHARLAAAIISALSAQVRARGCDVYTSDLQVRILATGLATYPDVSVVCGKFEPDPENKEALTNPKVLVEVLSPSTEEYDRIDKFEHYKQIESLGEYVLVWQSERRVEVRSRGAGGTWDIKTFGDGALALLPSVEARIDVRALYDTAPE